VRRHTAIPEPVQGTLFGHAAIHTLDGDEHRNRKAMFPALLKDPRRVADLAERTGSAWDEAVAQWHGQSPVVLFDEASRILTRAVCDWAGVPLAPGRVAETAADLTALVDGFATLGPRHWRARRARGRRERWLGGAPHPGPAAQPLRLRPDAGPPVRHRHDPAAANRPRQVSRPP
jgi:fatty-acid peroxygenase